jgi:hypothetical protein
MKKKPYSNKNKKILDNNENYLFSDDIENELLDDIDIENEDIDDIDIIDEDVDLVEQALIDEIVEIPEEVIVEKIITEDIVPEKKRRGRKPANKEKFYVEPKEFDQEIMNYYDNGKMSDKLADMVSKISHKLSYAPNFINYSYREEMVGDGVIRMMKALIAKKYNRDKGTNPFSYFTRIAFNAFRNRIKKEKHIHETHEKYQKEVMFMSEQFNNMSKNNNISIMKERNREY